MTSFRYYPPSPDDQRAFFAQFLGGALGIALCAFWAWRVSAAGLRGVLIGAAVAIIYLIARSAWQLELKAGRAERGGIDIDEHGFTVTDAHARSSTISWQSIDTLEVLGGKLHVAWHDSRQRLQHFELGAREMENGMRAIELIAARGKSDKTEQDTFLPPSNFISLEPK